VVLRFVAVRAKIRLHVTRFVSCVSGICLHVMRFRDPCASLCFCVLLRVMRVMRVACHVCRVSRVAKLSRVMRVACHACLDRLRFGSCPGQVLACLRFVFVFVHPCYLPGSPQYAPGRMLSFRRG
jgi:hypothetical protein